MKITISEFKNKHGKYEMIVDGEGITVSTDAGFGIIVDGAYEVTMRNFTKRNDPK